MTRTCPWASLSIKRNRKTSKKLPNKKVVTSKIPTKTLEEEAGLEMVVVEVQISRQTVKI